MLNKEVCHRCRDKVARHGPGLCWFCWTEMDEENWEIGYVECPQPYKALAPGGWARVDEDVPVYCPYIAEHVVSQDVE